MSKLTIFKQDDIHMKLEFILQFVAKEKTTTR